MKLSSFLTTLMLTSLVMGCASTPSTPVNWNEKVVETEYLSIPIWEKADIPKGASLRLYIEGEGNPRPRKPIAFLLAQKDPAVGVIYVSRPCQYAKSPACHNPAIWQSNRFDADIIEEMKELVLYLGHKYQASRIELVGYEGGATIALLLATRIPISRVITIAGILDTDSYAYHNGITLNGLNPLDEKAKLATIPQVHYVGTEDKLATRRLAERYLAKATPYQAQLKAVETNHTDWEDVAFDFY